MFIYEDIITVTANLIKSSVSRGVGGYFIIVKLVAPMHDIQEVKYCTSLGCLQI